MSTPFATQGLSLDQAPPLSVPASFFLTAPVAMVAAGVLLLWTADQPLLSTWAPPNIAALHLGTLGFLGSVMLGALYQMIPVVAGAPVPAVRLAHAVHAAFVVGVSALVYAQATGSTTAFWTALVVLGTALSTFWVTSVVALLRAPASTDTVRGMRLAMLGLLGVAFLGLRMAWGRGGPGYTTTWVALRNAHAAYGLITWVGGLLAAVSWQVVPMFYLTDEAPRWSRRVVMGAVAFTLVVPLALYLLDVAEHLVALSAAPGAVAVWLVHPVVTARLIGARRRRRKDPSLRFWALGLACGPLVLACGYAPVRGEDPRWVLLFGWLAVWGWAGLVMHGMLTRIVPFLVWFHRFAPLVGIADVPAMRQLLPDRRARAALALHVTTLGVGAVATVSVDPWAGRALGVCLVATGAVLGGNLVHVLRHRAPGPGSGGPPPPP